MENQSSANLAPSALSSAGRRVVVTGIGSIAPVGIGRAALWKAVLSGESSIRPIERFDTRSLSCRIAGQVQDKDLADLLSPRVLRTAPRVSQLALAAAALALEDARLGAAAYAPGSMGVAVGTALAGWADAEMQVALLLERGARRINPFIVSGSGSHGPGAEIAALLNAQGPQITVANGCTSGLEAIRLGALLVQSGGISMCLAGGSEAPLSASVFASLCRTQELSVLNDAPHLASCPFDRRHAGMVLSEGACFMVLEEAESAASRGCTPLAEIVGGESSCDARGLYSVDATGQVAAEGISRLLSRFSMCAANVDYVCSHANSSVAFDDKENKVLAHALGARCGQTPVSSIKGVLGHAFGASGAFQVAAAALALQNQTVPPNGNLEELSPGYEIANLPTAPEPMLIRNALVTAYGYGGMNSCMLIRSA